MRKSRFRACCAAFFVVLTLAILAAAEPRAGRAKPVKTAATPPKHGASSDVGDAGSVPPPPRGEGAPAPHPSKEDGGTSETRTIDGGAKVFRFGEVEIEGRLRSPQLVYFLRRVRAEFAADNLGHRSFMRELSETRKDPNF